jgi:type II secretory pathway component PulF
MTTASSNSDHVSLEQLIAFNEEVAALIRSGVPLELGLKQVGQSTTGRLSRLSQRLAERMETGVSLQQALDDEGDRIPGVYRAVVEAGLRSGRLPQALEEMSGLASSLLDLHRRIAIALLYPAIVFFMAWFLLGLVASYPIPIFLQARADIVGGETRLIRFLQWIVESTPIWFYGVPLTLLTIGLALSRRATWQHNSGAGRLVASRLHRFAWFPWIIENFDRATLARTLRLLIQNGLPLHESLLLAGWATGNRSIILDMTQVAQRLQSGETLAASLSSARYLPTFVKWMLVSGERNRNLAAVMETAGNVYQQRANHQAEMIKATLPALLTLGIGGTVTLLYCAVLFLPIADLIHQLASPTL